MSIAKAFSTPFFRRAADHEQVLSEQPIDCSEVALTLADLEQADGIRSEHLAEGL